MDNAISTYQRFRSYIDKKWKSANLIKRLTSILTFVALIISVFVAIQSSFFYRTATFDVKGDYLYFEAANDLAKTENKDGLISSEEIDKLLPQSWDTYRISHDIISYIQSIQPNVPVERLHSLSVFMTFDIENTGDKEAQNVELSVPVNGYCKIIRAGEKPVFAQIDNRQIKIGTVQPTDRVLIAVWGDKPQDDYGKNIVNLNDSYATRLYYNNDETTRITFPLKVGTFETWIRQQISFFFPVLILIVPMVLIVWFLCSVASSDEDEEVS